MGSQMLLGIVLFSGLAHAQSPLIEKQNFSNPVTQLTFHSVKGRLSLVSQSERMVTVITDKKSMRGVCQVDVQQNDTNLVITSSNGKSRPEECQVDIEVRSGVPLAVEGRLLDGNFVLRGIEGNLTVVVDRGQIDVETKGQRVSLKAKMGSVDIKGVPPTGTIDSENGGIRLEVSRFPKEGMLSLKADRDIDFTLPSRFPVDATYSVSTGGLILSPLSQIVLTTSDSDTLRATPSDSKFSIDALSGNGQFNIKRN